MRKMARDVRYRHNVLATALTLLLGAPLFTNCVQGQVCTPGAQVACACAGSDGGAQLCAPDGTRYEACICDGGPDGPPNDEGAGAGPLEGAGGRDPGPAPGNGGAGAACSDACSPGEIACLDEGTQHQCGQFDDDPCLDFGGEISCPGGCGDGRCLTDCVGPSSEACGNCGARVRTCDEDAWSDWGPCVGEGACSPNDTEPCGNGGSRTCTTTCQWSACQGQMCAGPSSQPCGDCGLQTRSCNNGSWSSWSACTNEGECAEAESRSCAGGTQVCDSTCTWGACVPSCAPGNHGQFLISGSSCADANNSNTCTFSAAGCAGDGGMKLKLAAAMISPTTIRFYVRKQDDTAWTQPATLTLYVGIGPVCSPATVPNVVKATAPATAGQETQTIELSLNPYAGSWSVGETKLFWVGKSEGGYPSYRATSTISVQRICAP